MKVHQVCQNWQEDRIIPRMARALAERLGWGLSAAVDPKADVVHLTGYFEATRLRPWPRQPVAAYFTHREEYPPNNAKARLFDATAKRVQLRIVTCRMYGEMVAQHGPTVEAAAPLERDHFVLAKAERRPGMVCGFSGYTYANKRKGEDLALAAVGSAIGQRVDWRASGRGWPVKVKRYAWADMPAFYQSLDVLVAPSRVEGIPMPPLEALACGVSVVVPWHVGLLDELPSMPGIHRYERGNAADLVRALEEAVATRPRVEREALREATAPYSVEAWVEDHAQAFEATFWGDAPMAHQVDAGMTTVEPSGDPEEQVIVVTKAPVERQTGSTRGIYCVAFGDPARTSALRMMTSAKQHMPDIPIALCAAKKIGPEDVLIIEPDSDVGGRRAKLKAYELAPAEWESVLYLDADTEVVAPIYQYFQWVEDGWELVICKDPHLMDTMASFVRANNKKELEDVQRSVRTLHTLQYNGGVWAFGRNERIARFFARWQAEWERYAQRDQGALIRAMYTDPLKVLVLGNEWNTFPKYTKGITTAGLMHYPGDARRWRGLLPGRIDSDAAWGKVKEFEQQQRGRRR